MRRDAKRYSPRQPAATDAPAPMSAPAASAIRPLPSALREKWLQRRTLPRPVAFWLGAAVLCLMLAASAATAPLYPVYQAQ